MEAMFAGFEILEYYTYIRGETHVSEMWKEVLWLRGWVSGRLCGRAMEEPASLDGKESPGRKARDELREGRLQTMTSFAVVMGIVSVPPTHPLTHLPNHPPSPSSTPPHPSIPFSIFPHPVSGIERQTVTIDHAIVPCMPSH